MEDLAVVPEQSHPQGNTSVHELNETNNSIVPGEDKIDPSIPKNWVETIKKDITQSQFNYKQKDDCSWSALNQSQNLGSRITENGIEVTAGCSEKTAMKINGKSDSI